MHERTIAVVGSGYWGKNIVRNFIELGALRTVCDSNPIALNQFATLHDVKREPDYAEVLRDDAVSGVVLAVPARLHYPMALAALDAGKDVFVEKPLALTVRDGTELVEKATSRGRVLLVGHLLEYHPALLALKQLVSTGELGKIRYLHSNRLNLGKFRTEENILWSFAPHDIAAILGLLGNELPVQVSAHGGSYLSAGVADVTMSTLTFASEARAHIFVSWLHPFKEQRLVVVGDQKMAEFADTDPSDKLKVYDHHVQWVDRIPMPIRGEARPIAYSSEEPLRLECQDFLNCIKDRARPRADGEQALRVLKVLAACQASLQNGGIVVSPGQSGKECFAHETAIVEQPVSIGKNTKIWHFTHVMPGCIIGKDCVLGQNVFLGPNVHMGDNVKVENNVSLFNGVTLEDDVFCGPSCVFTNVINPRSHVSRKHEFRPTLVKRGATIGANAVIVCGHTIGRYAFIGAGSVVTHDVADHALVYGNPARQEGWMCQCGVKLGRQNDATLCCPECGLHYSVSESSGSTLNPEEDIVDTTH
ncbi:MAG: Gfo/Idh/MocA family oxidoreductase [Dehalococcoidia bacterium]|nr:Gfo/Idh/MocA family oxidoreductase [Dehalococcoidia bacterium]